MSVPPLVPLSMALRQRGRLVQAMDQQRAICRGPKERGTASPIWLRHEEEQADDGGGCINLLLPHPFLHVSDKFSL
jgi:hypothetical protein